ncbi:hypothetical protein QOZ80_5AG0403950 [Eleusine coracana subsp. coracana]|nr:hypothetical protein QOZ80_5AG0403950 [Eleusine coracana subsp. coracana]
MPRAQAAARKNAAAAACVPSRDGGWLSLRTSKRRNPSSRTGHNDDDGLPFSDEILLAIFACSGVLSLADLVRCGATCRRWLRLISTEAEFICRRSSAPPSASRCTGLAVGFFHQMPEGDPRFIPLNTSRFPSFELEAGEMFRAARVVSSRNGRLVVQLRCASVGAALKLAVVNPITGDVRVLPTLSSKDRPGRYACALLTAADDLAGGIADPRAAGFLMVMLVYSRKNFTACPDGSHDRQLQVRVLLPDEGNNNGGGTGPDGSHQWKEAHKMLYPLPDMMTGRVQGVHLLQASERSGIILFITSRYDQLNPSNCLYALDTGKKMAQPWMIVDALPDGICWWWPKSRGSFHGYEMDRVDFLASLGGRGDGGNGA